MVNGMYEEQKFPVQGRSLLTVIIKDLGMDK